SVRWFNDEIIARRGRRGDRARTIIVGAGSAGERLVRELLRGDAAYAPVAFVDDNPAKRGLYLHGLTVAGTSEDVAAVARRYRATAVILAIPSASREQVARIVVQCKAAALQCRVVPSLPELLTGRAQVSQTRPIEVDDLLGRRAIHLDLSG